MLYSETLNRVHAKINPKDSALNMNCYYVTVVECLKVAPRKIKHGQLCKTTNTKMSLFLSLVNNFGCYE